MAPKSKTDDETRRWISGKIQEPFRESFKGIKNELNQQMTEEEEKKSRDIFSTWFKALTFRFSSGQFDYK